MALHAWDARGGGTADTVGEDQFKHFRGRLTEAGNRLKRAWELDNDCAPAAAYMVAVCMGLGHDRDEMEKWFGRAVAADPTGLPAYRAKMDYVLPKWHGSEEEALEFADQILKAGLWETGHPIMALGIQEEFAVRVGRLSIHFQQNPKAWKAVEPVMAEMRKRYPKSPLGASLYLFYAWLSDRNVAEAAAYVRDAEATGAELALGRFRSPDMLADAKKWLSEKPKDGKKE